MKHVYRIRVRPQRYFGLVAAGAPALSPQALAASFAGAVVHELTQTEWGDHVITLQLQRPTHEDALNEILTVVEQFGYSVIESTVTEWATSAARGALYGVGGGGVLGIGSRDPAFAVGSAVIGLVVGALVGSVVAQVKVIYQVHRAFPSGWVLVPMAQDVTQPVPGIPGLAQN
jgi:hypothetical protein